MNRDVAAVAVVALLAILALAAASATLDSTVTTGPGGGGVETPDNVTPIGGNGSGGLAGTRTPVEETGSLDEPPELCFPVLNEPPVIGLFVGAWVVLVVVLWRRYYAELAGAAGIFAGLWGLITHQFLADCGGESSQPPPLAGVTPNPNNTPTPAQLTPGNSSAGGAAQITEPSLAMGLLVVALLVVGVLVVYRMSGDTDVETVADPEAGEEADVGAIGSVAGEAADRIERQGSVENEVYRAWREMTTYLDVDDPAASTPGEFAAAAVGAGMAQRDVAELTRLFEEVRYGDRPADEDRSARAVSALRRIEAEYAESDPDDGSDRKDSASLDDSANRDDSVGRDDNADPDGTTGDDAETDASTDAGDEGTGGKR